MKNNILSRPKPDIVENGKGTSNNAHSYFLFPLSKTWPD